MGRKSTLKPGDIVNRTYELVRSLGSGYSGVVWEARHVCLPASYALKIMHEEDRDNEHKASRFRAEAGTLFQLQHENLVRIWDANETPEGLFYLVMDLLKGETLTQRLARGRLHPLRALRYAYDVACGLDAAHEAGVVHRDVKPDNLFITSEELIKILDFTAAKFFLASLRTTEPAARVGTIAFMSPEALEGTTSDARQDQYSLALCIHCMMRGKHPFERHLGNQYALMKAQSEERPEPLARVFGLPAWIDELLAPALAKRVEDRYPTMAHFARALHEGKRRFEREMRDGSLGFDAPLGDPIDLDADDGARTSQHVYVAPEEGVRHATAPVTPCERVSVAPEALPDAPVTAEQDLQAHPAAVADFDSAATAPLPATARLPATPGTVLRTTTAPVAAARMTTTHVRRPSPERGRWIARFAFALALPAAAGLTWRFTTRPSASAAAPASPSVTATAPKPSVTATAVPSAAPSTAIAEPARPAQYDERVAASASASSPTPGTAATLAAPAPSPPRRPQGTPEAVLSEDRRDAPAPTTPKVAAPAAPPPTPTSATPPPTAAPTAPPPTAAPAAAAPSAPHRVFGSEN